MPVAKTPANGSGTAIQNLLAELTKLPGVGPKSAERMAHYLLQGDRQHAAELALALETVVEKVRHCKECFHFAEAELCTICVDKRRDAGLLCVVETPRDVGLFERSGSFRGLYHVLGGRLAPLENVGPEKLTLQPLVQRIQQNGVREVILATSPTLEGDGTALLITNLLAGTPVKISRLARGLPTGASLELVNSQI
ncbi:MAG: recombination mediator RecR, partial [Gemmataceae bacterium]